VDIDESFTGVPAYDLLTLRNTSGRVVHNATILVELHGANNETVQNVHFVPAWQVGQPLFSHYGPGVQLANGYIGRFTVIGIREAVVSIWSDELRREGILYTYIGAERDHDIERLLGNALKVKWQYVKGDAFIIRALHLTLVGVPSLPPHRVTAIFKRGSEAKPIWWDMKAWKEGEEKRFSPPTSLLPWDPTTIDLEISFPESAYVVKKTLELAKTEPVKPTGGAQSR
jgi:hypothetical protein